MNNPYHKGYAGILGLIIVLVIVLLGLYMYADKDPQTGQSQKETHDKAIEDTKAAVQKIEVRNKIEME